MAVEDIMYGKNRHLFGGIEPSNMRVFEAVDSTVPTGAVKLNVQIPEDTVVDGQTLCTVAGAVVRRRYDRYPKDEFDGDLVCVITDKEPFVIQDDAIPSDGDYTTCFYSAFPYSTQDIYNRSSANRVVINNPKELASFRVRSKYNSESEKGSVRIQGVFDTTGEVTTAGVTIRKSTVIYPVDVNDGEFVADIPYDGNEDRFTIEDDNVSPNITYYYTAFAYSTNGVHNQNTNNKAECSTKSFVWTYGYDLDTTDSNPFTRVTYPGIVDNAKFTPVSHTGVKNATTDTYAFSYGDWEDCEFMPKPCMLKFDGTVGEYLNPNDYSKTITGEASNVSNRLYEGNAMMEWGKIWTKRWEDEDGIYHFRCSNEKLDDEYDCWCNYDKDNNQIDHFYTSIYYACRDAVTINNTSYTRMRSISGMSMSSLSAIPETFASYANKNGSGWYAECVSDRLLIQDLLVLIGKCTDTQTVFGGSTDGYPGTSGVLDASGLFGEYGTAVKVFGMENWWGGKFYRALPGVCIKNGYHYIKITPGTHDGSTHIGLNGMQYSSIDKFANLTDVVPRTLDDSSSGYIKYMKTLPYGRIPYPTLSDGGSASTYECDIAAFPNNARTDVHVYWVGGSSNFTGEYAPAIGAFYTRTIVSSQNLGNGYSTCALSYRANSTS